VIDEHQVSRMSDHNEIDKTIRAVYGHVVDILRQNDDEFYIPLVALEGSMLPADLMCHYIPMEEPEEQLAASYGEPANLIGLRVRVEYYGINWRSGVARVVPSRSRRPVGNLTEVPTRGFRYAVAGGGSV